MWPQNSAVFQCSGQEAGSFLELFQNKRKKLSLFPEVLRRVHRSWGNRAPHFHGNTPQVQHHISERRPYLSACADCPAQGRDEAGGASLWRVDLPPVLFLFCCGAIYWLCHSFSFPHFSDFMFCKSLLSYQVINIFGFSWAIVALEGKFSNNCTKGDTQWCFLGGFKWVVVSCCYLHVTLLGSNLCKKIVFLDSSSNYVT